MASDQPRPWTRFTADRREELLANCRVTVEQLFWLERSLVAIADHVRQKPTSTSVKTELRRLRTQLRRALEKPAKRKEYVEAAAKILARWKASARLDADREFRAARAEALGHIGMAYAVVEARRGRVELELAGDDPAIVILVDHIRRGLGGDRAAASTERLLDFAVEITSVGVDSGPSTQRSARIASPEVVRIVCEALERPLQDRPDDETQIQAIARLRPKWADFRPMGHDDETNDDTPFGLLIAVVLEQVTGRQRGPSSQGQIMRKYMKSRATPRPRGRPRKA